MHAGSEPVRSPPPASPGCLIGDRLGFSSFTPTSIRPRDVRRWRDAEPRVRQRRLRPVRWCSNESGTEAGVIPAKVSVKTRPMVAAGLAKPVEEVNPWGAPMWAPTAAQGSRSVIRTAFRSWLSRSQGQLDAGWPPQTVAPQHINTTARAQTRHSVLLWRRIRLQAAPFVSPTPCWTGSCQGGVVAIGAGVWISQAAGPPPAPPIEAAIK